MNERTAVTLPRNSRTYNIANSKNLSALLLNFLHRINRISRFAALTYRNINVIFANKRIFITKLARKFRISKNSRNLLKQKTALVTCIPARSGRHTADFLCPLENIVLKSAHLSRSIFHIDASGKRTLNRFRLLVDFLFHIRFITALFRFVGIYRNFLNAFSIIIVNDIREFKTVFRNLNNIAVLKINYARSITHNRINIRSNIIRIVRKPYDKRTAALCNNNLVRLVNTSNRKRIRSDNLIKRLLNSIKQVSGIMLFHKIRNDFRISFA